MQDMNDTELNAAETAADAADEAVEENAGEVIAEGNAEDTSEGADAAASAAEPPRQSMVSDLFDYLEILVFSVALVLVVFTLAFRLCRVSGSSMRNTLYNGEMLITTSLVDPQPGDVIVFHRTSEVYEHFNEPLVKRVIASEGQTVRYDYNTKKLYVDGVEVDDSHAHYLDNDGTPIGVLTQTPMHDYDPAARIFEVTVPEGKLFVMGDNRNHSSDSRSIQVGFVDKREVLGKVIANLGQMKCGK